MWFSSPTDLIAAIWEGKRKDRMLRRIAQPRAERTMGAAFVVIICVGGAALLLAASALVHAVTP